MFGLSVESLPHTLTDVRIDFQSEAPENQLRAPLRLTDSTLGYDILSHQLGVLSQRLVTMELCQMTADLNDFFQCSKTSVWPVLQKLIFMDLQPASADGTWLFDHSPGINMEEFMEEYTDTDALSFDEMRQLKKEDDLPPAIDTPLFPFRTAINPAKFRSIYLAAADAVKRMPKLRVLHIYFEDKCEETGIGRSDHEFRYARNTTCPAWYADPKAEITVGWALPLVVDIDTEVLSAWKEVGEYKDALVGFHRWDVDAYQYDYQVIEVNA